MKKVLSTAAALGFCLYLPVAAFAGGPVATDDAVARELQDLRSQLANQQAEIDMLKEQKVVPASAPDLSRLDAFEKENWVHALKKKVDVTLYGQVNKAVLFADDGHQDDVFFVDNAIAGTRLGVTAKSKLNDEFSTGGQLEFEWTQNNSSAVNMTSDNTGDSDNAAKRQMKVWGQSKTAGKLTLGHGSVAADGIAQIDLSGTSIAGRGDAADGAAFRFFDQTALSAYSADISVGSVISDLDGGRKDHLRYDSPTFFGVTLSGTTAEGDYNDVAVGYNSKFGDTQVQAGVAYTWEPAVAGSTGVDNIIVGSASVLLPFGLNFTGAAGEKQFENTALEDGFFWYGKAGYQLKALTVGSTAFSVAYGEYDDLKAGNSLTNMYEATSWGAEMVQKFDALNTEFYVAYRLYELDEDNINVTDYDDISLVWSGARFSF